MYTIIDKDKEDVKLHLVEYSNVFDLWVESKVDFLPNITIQKKMSFEDVRTMRDKLNEILGYFDESM